MDNAKHPENIRLTQEQVSNLKTKILDTNLSSADQQILIGLISSCLWLQSKLALSKITITGLRSLFGFSTEKKSLKTKQQTQLT